VGHAAPGECCTDYESMAAPRVNSYLAPSHNAERRAGQAASIAFQSSVWPTGNRTQPTNFGGACSTNCFQWVNYYFNAFTYTHLEVQLPCAQR